MRKYIQRFCRKRNTISDIEERTIVIYFKQGLRDDVLFHKLARKDIRTCEELFEIANQYANAEKAINMVISEPVMFSSPIVVARSPVPFAPPSLRDGFFRVSVLICNFE